MTVTATLAPSSLSCPACDGPVEVKSRHVAITGTVVRVYCSAECMRARVKPAPPQQAIDVPRPRRRVWWLTGGATSACVLVSTAIYVRGDDEIAVEVPPPPAFHAAVVPEPPIPPPPVDPRIEEDRAVVQEILQDTWIHPLAGPSRRMPRNHNGAFGASRPGERPPECVSGHCGVDIGHDWGEPIHAVHDGIVDWVNRGPNEERGGIFVKIAHRNGTLYSWYFHLAAVPRRIRPGVAVSAGDVIGVLGDTGIKHSAPHLHFSLSVKPSKAGRERYLDPEPLIAIWPLWITDAEGGGRPSSTIEPGVPVRRSPQRRAKPAEPAAAPDAPAPAAPAPEAAAPEAVTAPAQAPPTAE